MDIALSGGVRNNLFSLQNTSKLIAQTQNRLATGLKVNSALDNPNSFFTARSLNGRADDLSTLQDGLGQNISTLKAAEKGIDAIEKLLQNAKSIANQALASTDNTVGGARDDLAADFNAIMAEIEEIAEDSGYNGVNLLEGDNMTAIFNEDRSNTYQVTGVDYSDATAAAGLDVDDATAGAGAWADTDSTINTALTEVQAAIETVRTQASSFSTSLSIIETRADFTNDLVNTLEEGADKLTLADLNEEAATLLTLQTRQQLGNSALQFSAQSEQSILRLF